MKFSELKKGLARYLSDSRAEPVEIQGLLRIPGGASRETWQFDAVFGQQKHGLIVRIDPTESLIETERRTEFAAMRAAFLAGLKAPEPLDCVEDLQWLGRPFSISVRVPGSSQLPHLDKGVRDKIGRLKWTILGRLAGLELSALDLGDTFTAPKPEACAPEQLDYWANVLVEDGLHPDPIAAATIRWLRKNLPPPPQKLCLVHGDYRTGNFLCSPDGEITAILDWEMAHIGDPLEDLAWSFDPVWSWEEKENAGLLVPHAEAIEYWEAASGLRVDPDVFHWWRVFVALKGLAIWTSSSEAFHQSVNKNLSHAIAGWFAADRQHQVLIDYLSPLSNHRFPRIG
ncbi:MAG: phosphotransferase family protein [Parvibaculaceae bacterium]